ncbi:hypothetical protein JW992_07935, partial [candidate division KSB1 bacterium]|nr:hypothetical protein [candidate division KSB1 bacterium]
MQNKLFTIALIGFCLGFAALSVQVIYLRAFLAVFFGNELSVGLVLALWLMWGGIGAKLAGKGIDRLVILPKTVFFALAFSGAALGLVAVRFVRIVFFVSQAQPLNFTHLVLGSAIFSALPCLVFGMLFALTSRDCTCDNSPARVYFFETLGSLVGGLITTFLGLQLGNDWLAFGLVATVVLGSVAWAEKRSCSWLYPLAAAIIFLGFEFFSVDQRLESV